MARLNYWKELPRSRELLERNAAKPEGDHGRCIICNAPIRNPDRAKWVHEIDGGGTLRTPDDPEPYDPAGELGAQPVGPECYRKYRAILKPYVA